MGITDLLQHCQGGLVPVVGLQPFTFPRRGVGRPDQKTSINELAGRVLVLGTKDARYKHQYQGQDEKRSCHDRDIGKGQSLMGLEHRSYSANSVQHEQFAPERR